VYLVVYSNRIRFQHRCFEEDHFVLVCFRELNLELFLVDDRLSYSISTSNLSRVHIEQVHFVVMHIQNSLSIIDLHLFQQRMSKLSLLHCSARQSVNHLHH
jgi:hypothetical protein